MSRSVKQRLAVVGIMLFAAVALYAQHNVYVNENGRTRIVNSVDKITYGVNGATVWSDTTRYVFDGAAVKLMSLTEKDSWRAKVMPERYLKDFDYDISFLESDKEQVVAESEVTDESNKLYSDFVEHSTWSKTVNIAFDGNTAMVSGDVDSMTVSINGAHVTIETETAEVKYILTGSSDDAFLKLYSGKKCCVVLNGVTLTNPNGPVINSQMKKHLFIDLAEGTVNTLTDGATYTKVKGEDQRGCVFAEGKLCISGNGQLYVNGNKKCGIASDNHVHMLGGFVHVTTHAEKGKAVYGKDNIIIGGGVLRAYADGVASKGIASDSLITITGGVIKSITTGNALWDDEAQDYSSCCALKSGWDMTISGGKIYCLSTGSGGKGISAGDELITIDAKGNAKTTYHGTMTISDADIYVRTSGKRIPEVKTEDAHGQKVEASASPKGLKSADKMTINSGNIYVRCSGGAAAEGIESKRTITINGGKIRTYCVDDGMNAEGCYMNGGDVLICSTENDGFDVSFLFVNDGLLYTIGADIDQMGLDTDGKTFKVMGGEVVALGARNCQPYSSSALANVMCYVKNNVSYVALTDSDGNTIRVIPTPDTYDKMCLLFSNSSITVGNKYKIISYKSSLADVPVTEYEFTVEGVCTTLGSYK